MAAPILRPIARAREPGRGRSRLELAIVNHSLRTSRSIGYFPCIRVLRDVSQLGAIGREASRGSGYALSEALGFDPITTSTYVSRRFRSYLAAKRPLPDLQRFSIFRMNSIRLQYDLSKNTRWTHGAN